MFETETSVKVNKIKSITFLVFALLTFYQFGSYANRVHRSTTASQTEIDIPPNSDVALTVNLRIVDSAPVFVPFILLLTFNIAAWVMHPLSVGRLPLTLTLIANLSIFVIRDRIADAALKSDLATRSLNIKDLLSTLRIHIGQWNMIYLLLASVSALLVIGMLIQIWRKQQFRPYSLI